MLFVERLSAPVRDLAARSAAALDRPLAGDAELLVATAEDEDVVSGAFDLVSTGPRRGSGGGPVRVGPGSVWMQLALSRADALVACDPPRLLNRYVRPLLAALTKSGALAHYFGRDWVSASKRPVAFVGFAHDAGSGRALVEAVVAVTTPFREPGAPTFMGKPPVTLADLAPSASVASLGEAIASAYATSFDRTLRDVSNQTPAPSAPPHVAAWDSTADEAIGLVGAGHDASGALRVGGELMASRDAVQALERALASLDPADAEAIGIAIDDAFSPPATVFGIKSLRSIQDVVLAASRG